MNNELAMRTFAYLISNYKENNETIINSEEIEAIQFLIEENQSLNKQLEEAQENIILLKASKPMLEYKKALEENQQKEFIDWLEDWQKAIKIQHEELNDPVRKGFLKVTMDTIEEILSKFKEIVGVSNEK